MNLDAINAELLACADRLEEFSQIESPSDDDLAACEAIERRIDEMTELKEAKKPSTVLTRGGNVSPNYKGPHWNSTHATDGAQPGGSTSYCTIHGLEASDLSNGGFSSAGEFFAVMASGRYDDRLQAMRAANGIGISATGGVLVPEQFIATQLHPPTEDEIVLPRATTYPMTGETLHLSGVANLSEASGAIHGFTAQWVEEHGSFIEQEMALARTSLHRKKLGLFCRASNELVMSSDFERELIPSLNRAVSYERDRAFLTGSGVGKPLGVINSASTIEVAKESGQPGATIVTTNLDKMIARIHPALFNESVWVCNPTCLPQLMGLSRVVGTGGSALPVMSNNGTLTVHTRPVLFSSKLPVLGTSGDIILAAFSQYAIGLTRGIVVDKSEQYKFQNDQTVWRARFLCDGQSRWATAFTPEKGDTLSWCVKLATRS